MSSTGKEYLVLQNFKFKDEPSDGGENFAKLPPIQFVSNFETIPAQFDNSQQLAASKPIKQETTESDNAAAPKNLGYSVYAENFNKLLQQDQGQSRRKSSVRPDEEEDVVIRGTESDEDLGGRGSVKVESNEGTGAVAEMQANPQNQNAQDQNIPINAEGAAEEAADAPLQANVQDNARPAMPPLNQDRFTSKPSLSYALLVALALKNCKSGKLTVQEVYNFIDTNFPFFQTANSGWKNSVRHNLSFSRFFRKIEARKGETDSRRSFIWTFNPNKRFEIEQVLVKSMDKDKANTKRCLANPEDYDKIRNGTLNFDFRPPSRRRPGPPMVPVGGRQAAGVQRQVEDTGPSRPTYQCLASVPQQRSGPRRVLNFDNCGGSSSNSLANNPTFGNSMTRRQASARPTPELTRLLTEGIPEDYCQQNYTWENRQVAVTKYPSAPEIQQNYEVSPPAIADARSPRVVSGVLINAEGGGHIANGNMYGDAKQEVFRGCSQYSLPDMHAEPQVQLTPPRKSYSANWDFFDSYILSPGNNVMLSDAIINKSPEQEMKFLNLNNWHYEPVTPSRWTTEY